MGTSLRSNQETASVTESRVSRSERRNPIRQLVLLGAQRLSDGQIPALILTRGTAGTIEVTEQMLPLAALNY